MGAQDSTDTILWNLTSLRFVFDTAKASTQVDDAAKDPVTHYNSPLYRTHRHGYNFFSGAFGLDSATGTHALILFALFPGDYDGLLTRPFPKMIQLSVRHPLDPHNKWIVTLEPSKNLSFRRPVRDLCRALTNFKFCPQSKIFSKTGNFLLNNTLYLEVKLTDLPDPEGATPSTSQP